MQYDFFPFHFVPPFIILLCCTSLYLSAEIIMASATAFFQTKAQVNLAYGYLFVLMAL